MEGTLIEQKRHLTPPMVLSLNKKGSFAIYQFRTEIMSIHRGIELIFPV
jgi:hypothetical protein